MSNEVLRIVLTLLTVIVLTSCATEPTNPAFAIHNVSSNDYNFVFHRHL